MSDSVETVAAATSKVKVVEALVRLGKAVQKSTIYPDGHPAIPGAVNVFFEALRQALDERAVLSLGVVSDRILIEGEPVDAKNAALAWLAQQMYERGVGAIDFKRNIPEAEGVRFVQWLAKPISPETALEEPPVFEGIVLTRYDYARVRFGEDPSSDATVRTDPTRVWLVLMGGLFGSGDGTGDGDGAGDGSGGGSGGQRLSIQSLDDPEEMARALCQRLSTSGGSESPAAVASRVLAMGSHLNDLTPGVRETVKKKLGMFIGGLTPELRSELLRVDPRSSRQKLEFVTEISDALPDTTVLEILGNLDRTGAHIPHQFITLMNKLIGISDKVPTLNAQVGEKLESLGVPKTLLQSQPEKMREVLEEVLQSRMDKNWNPEQYQALLEQLSMRRLDGQTSLETLARYGDPRVPEDVRAHVSEIALRLLVARPESPESTGYVRCLDEDAPRALESGRYEQLHDAAAAVKEIAESHTDLDPELLKLSGVYIANFSKEERIEKILSTAMAHTIGRLPASIHGLFKLAGGDAAYAAFQKLAPMAECPESGRLSELLLGLEPEVFNAAVARLRPEGWSSLRPLFTLLHRLDAPRAVELALTFLGNEDHRLRIEAYRILLVMDQRPGQVGRYIERALGDESPKVAAFGIAQAKLRADAEAAGMLQKFLAKPSRGKEEDLSLRAVGALASFRFPEARDILIALIRSRKITFWVREVNLSKAIEEALTQIGDDEATAAVRAWRRSPSRWISLLLVQGKVDKVEK